jgi:RNA polymerase sigma factor (sigma-70 family)
MCLFLEHPPLLSAFREGEETALTTIYRRYAAPVGTYLSNLARATGAFELAQPSAIADLLQEVFARAFPERARRAYDERRPFGPYLNTIARNCFVDLIRKRRLDLACEPHDPNNFDRAPSDWVEQEFERNLLAAVEACVSELSAPLREVYEQRFEIGLTQKATCHALGITRRALRTAEAHLKRGVYDALSAAGVVEPAGE